MIFTMAQAKRRGRKKQTPIISNTGFIGSVFIDTLELQRNPIISLVKNFKLFITY
ncbi:hypothetical protein AAHB49_05710 [Bacillus cereus]